MDFRLTSPGQFRVPVTLSDIEQYVATGEDFKRFPQAPQCLIHTLGWNVDITVLDHMPDLFQQPASKGPVRVDFFLRLALHGLADEHTHG